jgi:hypothetical protein
MIRFSRERYIVYCFDPRNTPSVAADLDVEFSTAPDAIDTILRDRASYNVESKHEKIFRKALSEGETCFTAWSNGALAFYGWVQFRERRPGGGMRLPLPPSSAFIYRCFTRAEFRGKKIYPAAISNLLPDLAANGIDNVFIDHATNNVPSAKGISRLGATPIGAYWLYRFGRIRLAVGERGLSLDCHGVSPAPFADYSSRKSLRTQPNESPIASTKR